MKLFLITIAGLLYPFLLHAQQAFQSDNLIVTQNAPLAFSYDIIDEALTDKVINNAFTITVDSRKAPYAIYCYALFPDQRNTQLSGRIGLKLRHTNSTAYSDKTNSGMRLSQAPVHILDVPRNTNATTYNYDVILYKQTSLEPAGTYPFSLAFTFVAP